MGIRGLTGYVAERRATLGQQICFGSASSDSEPVLRDEEDNAVFIIDGSAWVYHISNLHIDWTHGGESVTLKEVIRAYLSTFNAAYVTPVFVWDGSFDTLKLETAKSRLQQTIKKNVTYMRAGPSLQNHAGFRKEIAILPQIAMRACISFLREMAEELQYSIEQYFPAGEADFFIANLAIERNAYILSRDSDFFVTSYGSAGYIPLDTIDFHCRSEPAVQNDNIDGSDDSEWSTVTTKASSGKRAATARSGQQEKVVTGIASSYTSIGKATQITCRVYHADKLSASLSLPSVDYLPLVACLSGNDYYTPQIWRSSGSPRPSGSSGASAKRFETIAANVSKAAQKRRKVLVWAEIPEFARRVLDETREFALTEGQISDMARQALETLSEYCVSSLCFGFLKQDTQDSPSGRSSPSSSAARFSHVHNLLLPSNHDSPSRSQAKLRIYNALETGRFRSTLLQIINLSAFLPNMLVEDPDKISPIITCGGPLRVWIYAILHDCIGLGSTQVKASASASASMSDTGEGVSNHDDEEVKELMEKTDIDEQESATPEENGANDSPHCTTILEYIRRGSNLAAEPVEVPLWSTINPLSSSGQNATNETLLSRSTRDRLNILLHATSSFTDRLEEMGGGNEPLLTLMLALRHLSFVFDGTAHVWLPEERRAALLMGSIAHKQNQSQQVESDTQARPTASNDRSRPSNSLIQRAAELTTALSSISMLIETLLLTPIFPHYPESLYQGSLFARFLRDAAGHTTAEETLMQAGLDPNRYRELVEVMEEGLPNQADKSTAFVQSKQKKKKHKGDRPQAQSTSQGNSMSNKFALLSL